MAKKRPVSLTRLEGDVMRVVWAAGPNPVRARDVVDALNARGKKRLAYNTVQTILTILKTKGVVDIVEGPGRAHLYRARVSQVDASRTMVAELVERLFSGRVEPLLQQLIHEAPLDPAELRRLREWVDARLRDATEDAP